MLGNQGRVLRVGPDVAGDIVVVGEIEPVGFLAFKVPFGRENTAAAGRLKTKAKPANSGEEVNEAESRGGGVHVPSDLRCLAENIDAPVYSGFVSPRS